MPNDPEIADKSFKSTKLILLNLYYLLCHGDLNKFLFHFCSYGHRMHLFMMRWTCHHSKVSHLHAYICKAKIIS